MRIKAWIVTGAATVLAGTALGIVVAANDPRTAEPAIYGMFWGSLGLVVWGFWITFLLACRVNVVRAVWIGLMLSTGLLGAVLSRQAGYRDARLLAGIIFATLSVSFFIWRHYRDGRT